MNDDQKQPLKQKILQGIQSGEFLMRPKLHFTLRVLATIVVSLAVLAISVFIFNFILFSLRINHHDTLLEFGTDGLVAFLFFFPWLLLIIDIALIALLEWLLRQFRFGYKLPVLYLLLGIIALTGVTGVALDRGTSFNDRMVERTHRLPPPMGQFYEGVRKPWKKGSGFCHCEIVAIDGSTMIVSDLRKGTTTLTVVFPKHDERATTTDLKVGDVILIAGKEKEGTIYAFGVRKIEDGRVATSTGQ